MKKRNRDVISRSSGLLTGCTLSFPRLGYPIDKDYLCYDKCGDNVKVCEILYLESMYIEFTYKCNLGGGFCYNKLVSPLERHSQTFLDAVELAERMDVHTILLTGGEPLLSPLFEYYYPLIHSKFRVTINTKLSNLPSSIISLFKKYPPTLVNVSVYGMSSENFKFKTNAHIGFDVVLENLKVLRSEDIPVFAKYIAFNEKYSEIEEFEEFCRKNSIKYKIYTNPLPHRYSHFLNGNKLQESTHICEIYKVNVVVSPRGFLRSCVLLPDTSLHVREALGDVHRTYRYLKQTFVEEAYKTCPYRYG